jgi:hypothetical protein
MSSSKIRMIWICVLKRTGPGGDIFFLTRFPSSMSTPSTHHVTAAGLPSTFRCTDTGTLRPSSRAKRYAAMLNL